MTDPHIVHYHAVIQHILIPTFDLIIYFHYFCTKLAHMTRIVLDIPNESDLEALLPLLRRLRITVAKMDHIEKEKPDIEAALEIVGAGCDMSSFGDALAWQKESRKDRQLPYRD
jgi:hypothetical protein